MKRRAACLLAAAATIAGVAACQTGDSRSEYLQFVHDKGIDAPDDLLVDVAHQLCDYIDGGGTLTGYGQIARGADFDLDDAAAIAAATVTWICPDNSDWIPS